MSLHPCTPAFLGPCIPASLRPCIPASLHPCVPASLRPFIPASLHPGVPAPLHPTSLRPCVHVQCCHHVLWSEMEFYFKSLFFKPWQRLQKSKEKHLQQKIYNEKTLTAPQIDKQNYTSNDETLTDPTKKPMVTMTIRVEFQKTKFHETEFCHEMEVVTLICTCMHVCICTRVHVYTCTRVHVYTCTCVHFTHYQITQTISLNRKNAKLMMIMFDLVLLICLEMTFHYAEVYEINKKKRVHF